jgi:acetyltransferase-like isoleucine patch superfamily enzyme
MESPYFTREELLAFGFSRVGDPVWISRKCSFYAIRGALGDHVRMDDFCVVKGEVSLGSYIHVAGFCSLSGVAAPLLLEDCCSVGNRVSIYTGSDDFHADALAGNTVPASMVHTLTGRVRLGRGALVGAHSVVMPGVDVGDGAAVGAQCVVTKSVPPGTILVSGGMRSLPVGRRDVKKILALVDQLLPGKGAA